MIVALCISSVSMHIISLHPIMLVNLFSWQFPPTTLPSINPSLDKERNPWGLPDLWRAHPKIPWAWQSSVWARASTETTDTWLHMCIIFSIKKETWVSMVLRENSATKDKTGLLLNECSKVLAVPHPSFCCAQDQSILSLGQKMVQWILASKRCQNLGCTPSTNVEWAAFAWLAVHVLQLFFLTCQVSNAQEMRSRMQMQWLTSKAKANLETSQCAVWKKSEGLWAVRWSLLIFSCFLVRPPSHAKVIALKGLSMMAGHPALANSCILL